MTEERKKILDMLADGKITSDEAEKLLNAVYSKNNEIQKGGDYAKTNFPK